MNIKKQLRFAYRYLITARRWRKWINTQVVIVLIAAAIFTAALAWSTASPANGAGSLPNSMQTQTVTPKQPAAPTFTPFPPEYLSNAQQTIGITFAGAILVLIVVIGVIVFMPKGNGK